MLIERPPKWFRRLFPGAVFRMPQTGRKTVYLTFDDGPVPRVTPGVLDILDRFGAKATFFVVGENAARFPELLKEIRLRGHAVGNHTMKHVKGLSLSTADYLKDAEKCRKITDSALFRPPHGILKPSQLHKLKKKYNVIMYDLVTRDYSKHLTSGDVIRNVRRYARDGSIIVFHDSLKSLPRIVEALPAALQWLSDQGYGFGLLDSLREPGKES